MNGTCKQHQLDLDNLLSMQKNQKKTRVLHIKSMRRVLKATVIDTWCISVASEEPTGTITKCQKIFSPKAKTRNISASAAWAKRQGCICNSFERKKTSLYTVENEEISRHKFITLCRSDMKETLPEAKSTETPTESDEEEPTASTTTMPIHQPGGCYSQAATYMCNIGKGRRI